MAFPEAVGLIKNVDVRASGLPVGTVRDVEVDEQRGRALATIELESRYAPLAGDSRAILRRKTLLGETFVEIAPGSASAPKLPDGGRLDDSRVAGTVELDEIFQTYDPNTRRAFKIWQRELGTALGNRGESLNNALGQLPEFAENGADLLGVLDEHESALRGLVRDTGEVYSALSQDERQLRRLITGSHGVFRQTAAEREDLATAFQIFPTFLFESKATLERLESFSANTRPLVRDLRPVMRELRPTVRSVRAIAPDLKRFFRNFDQQITASRRGLPALRETLDETRPLLASLGPFLSEFNPIFQWLEVNQHLVSDFLGYAASGLADTNPTTPAGETGHYLRQLSVSGRGVGGHPPSARPEQPRQRLPASCLHRPRDLAPPDPAQLGLQALRWRGELSVVVPIRGGAGLLGAAQPALQGQAAGPLPARGARGLLAPRASAAPAPRAGSRVLCVPDRSGSRHRRAPPPATGEGAPPPRPRGHAPNGARSRSARRCRGWP